MDHKGLPTYSIRNLVFALKIKLNFKKRLKATRITHNYKQSLLQKFEEDVPLNQMFEHRFFDYIKGAYVEQLDKLNQEKTLKQANEIISLPFLNITEKSLTAPSGNKSDYLSFKPYFWLDGDINPLTKLGTVPEYLDGRPNPYLAKLSDKPKLAQLCARIHLLGIAFHITKNARYLDVAKKQIHIWFIDPETRMSPHMEYAQIMPWSGQTKGIGIIDARWLILLIDGLVMFGVEESFSKGEKKAIANWLHSFATWIMKSTSGKEEVRMKNNRGTWVDALLVYISLTLGKNAVAQQLTRYALENRPDEQITKDFKQHLELSRYTFVSYSLYNIFPMYHLMTYANWSMSNDNKAFLSSRTTRKVNFLINSSKRLASRIPKHEVGKIESIQYKATYDLNLFYPYSLAQAHTFPAIFPFVRE